MINSKLEEDFCNNVDSPFVFDVNIFVSKIFVKMV